MYEPKRDYRFEYVWDVMTFIEERQCETCVFRSDREEYPMCGEIEALLTVEQPVPDLDDVGEDGVVCRRYRDAELAAQEENQETLFDI